MIRDSRIPKRDCALVRTLILGLLMLGAGCETARDVVVPASDEEANWKIVQAYNELHTAWHAKTGEIYRSDDSDEQKDRRLEEEAGEHPDIMLAVTAARAIVDGGGERALDAATFLVEHSAGMSKTEDQDFEFGMAALKSLVGADWSRVDASRIAREEWQSQGAEIRDADISDDEKIERMRAMGDLPKDMLAIGAAFAIAELGAAHERSREAAEFLIDGGHGGPLPQIPLMAAHLISEHFPDYDGWTNVLSQLNYMRPPYGAGSVDEFIADMASTASDPVVRATARYFVAAALMHDLNNESVTTEQHGEMRQRALTHAMDLSVGVEDEEFVRKVSENGQRMTKTLAEVEAMILHGIRHATVGGTLADETGRRLDGSEEKLSAYAGKVILMDFWATWCGPCVGSLPDLRELAGAYPKEAFEILAISVDDEAETVTEFMRDEPMPWAQWHVGENSELARLWQIYAFPTYVVVDETGRIMGRSSDLEASRVLIEQALGAEHSTASET
ncbi:MAG: TlpA disulfide reductase family protein [Gammaproteobacteria bacterium]|nr:TlpA disulfide reductase family protein [Gammaproteobacteria bacterium]